MSESSRKRSNNAFLKFILTMVNLVVLLCETLLVGAIIVLTATEKNALIESFGQKTYEISFGVVIAISVTVILITLLGAVGAVKESSALLKIYSMLMLFFLICEVGALAFTATQIEMTSKYTETALYESIRLYNSSELVTKAWDVYQNTNHCCGMRRGSEPKVPPHHAFARANLTKYVPESCCLDDLDDNMLDKCMRGSEYFIHKKDCYAVLKEQLEQSFSIIVGLGSVGIVITASGLILSVMMLMSL